MDNAWYYAEWAKKYRDVAQDTADGFGTWAAKNGAEGDPEWLIWECYQSHLWGIKYGGRDKY